MDIQSIKQRFGIIGNSQLLNRAIDVAMQVAPTDINVFITGESGSGKEVFPQIIHHLSSRKHGPYIPVNCGAIPEGTIDSELFGHEKGSFTGAHEARKGYFEVVNTGTIFLDEVAELPVSTQVRLLRVLESGEFMKVGSSKVIKTDVRVVAATNVDITKAIQTGKFREDLFYRLNTVPIYVPSLRERKEDIVLLFRKFASDFAEKYRMPSIQLDEGAREALINYRWKGNVRQLKNITEQISIIEKKRELNADLLLKYLPRAYESELPVLYRGEEEKKEFSEREILYKVLFEMKRDIVDMKKLIREILHDTELSEQLLNDQPNLVKKLYHDVSAEGKKVEEMEIHNGGTVEEYDQVDEPEIIEESLSLQKKEVDMIRKALEKHSGKRKNAARELGISERTLYRKIKEYNIG